MYSGNFLSRVNVTENVLNKSKIMDGLYEEFDLLM